MSATLSFIGQASASDDSEIPTKSTTTASLHDETFGHDIKIINNRESGINIDLSIEAVDGSASIVENISIEPRRGNNQLVVDSIPLPSGSYNFILTSNRTEVTDEFPLSSINHREYERIVIRILPGKIKMANDEI
jgi:hypothetical protein